MARKKKPRRSFGLFMSEGCIANSERNSLHWCIMALGTVESIPGAQHVRVDKNEVRFSYGGYRYVFPTPPKSAAIAENYDKGLVLKSELKPWHDTLKDAISIEPIQHRRPSPAKAKEHVKKEPCTRRRSTRWNGRALT